jgi:hypothetical protein
MMIFFKKSTLFVAFIFMAYQTIAQIPTQGIVRFPEKKIYLSRGYSSMGADGHTAFYEVTYNNHMGLGGAVEIVFLNIKFHGNSSTRYCFNRPNGTYDCYPRTDGMGIGRLMDIHGPSYPTLEYIDFTYDITYNGKFVRTASDNFGGNLDTESPNIKLQINIPNNQVTKGVKIEEILRNIRIDNLTIRSHIYARNVIDHLNALAETDFDIAQEAERQARIEKKKKEDEQRKAELAKEEERKKAALEKQKVELAKEEQKKKEELEKQKTELANKKEANEKLLKEKGNGVAATSNTGGLGDKTSTAATSSGSSAATDKDKDKDKDKSSTTGADSNNSSKPSYGGPPIALSGVDGASNGYQTPTKSTSNQDLYKKVERLNEQTQAQIQTTNNAISAFSNAISDQFQRDKEEKEAKIAYVARREEEIKDNLRRQVERENEEKRKDAAAEAASRAASRREWNKTDTKKREDAYKELANDKSRFELWVNACRLGTIEGLESYLSSYKYDYFSNLANAMIEAWKYGKTAPNDYIKLAIEGYNWPLVDFLMDNGGNADYYVKNTIFQEQYSTIRQFLDKGTDVGEALQYKDDQRTAFVKKLIEHGANPNADYNRGSSECASYVIRLLLLNDYKGELLKWLLENGKLNQSSMDDGMAFLLDQYHESAYNSYYEKHFKKYEMGKSRGDSKNISNASFKILDNMFVQMKYLVQYNAAISGKLIRIVSNEYIYGYGNCGFVNYEPYYSRDETDAERYRRLRNTLYRTESTSTAHLESKTFTIQGDLQTYKFPKDNAAQLDRWVALQKAFIDKSYVVDKQYLKHVAIQAIENYSSQSESNKLELKDLLEYLVKYGRNKLDPDEYLYYSNESKSSLIRFAKKNDSELGVYLRNIDNVLSKAERKRYRAEEKEDNKIQIAANDKKIIWMGLGGGLIKVVNVNLNPSYPNTTVSSSDALSYTFPISFRITNNFHAVAEASLLNKTLDFNGTEEEGTHFNFALLGRYFYKLNRSFSVYGNIGCNYDYLISRRYKRLEWKDIDLTDTNRKSLGIASGVGIVFKAPAGAMVYFDYRYNYQLSQEPTKHFAEFRYKNQVSTVDDSQNRTFSIGVLCTLKNLFSFP